MPSADEQTCIRLARHNVEQTEKVISRRIAHIDGCVLARKYAHMNCGLKFCGAATDRLCGDERPVLLPSEPVRWI